MRQKRSKKHTSRRKWQPRKSGEDAGDAAGKTKRLQRCSREEEALVERKQRECVQTFETRFPCSQR